MEKKSSYKNFPLAKNQNKLIPFQASACENISAKRLKTISKCRFEIFRPIGRNANAKFKRAPNFLGDEIQKFASLEFCVLSPSREVQNFRPIGAEIKNRTSILEIGHCSARPQ